MRALLVVDNCEHVIGAVAATVEKILEAGPGVRVLATSRQPLRVPGERVWQIPPIAFPDTPSRHRPGELASFDAVRLFLDRAPELADPTPGELRVIAEITAQLEGLPLAIELAAARAAQLDLQQLALALQDRISLSWLGSRTVRARQQTLAATIGWSYDLLTPPLQSALKRLAVFVGGFTLEAAAAVTGAEGNITSTVASLAERSLIEADRSARTGQPRLTPARYRMLETIQQYCAARAAADNGPAASTAAQDAHSNYFVGLARQASAALTGWHQGRWMTTLDPDYANLTAAITYLLTSPGRAGHALQMIIDLDRFWWWDHGHQAEMATLLRRALDAAGQAVTPAIRCEALNVACLFAIRNDMQAARSFATQALHIAQAAGDDFQAARALSWLAWVGYCAGDLDQGSAAAKAAAELARSVGDPVLLGECLTNLGHVTSDLRAQKAVYREALAVTRRSGDRGTWADVNNNLGVTLLLTDDLEAARHHFELAQAIFREMGVPAGVLVENLGWLHLRKGDLSAADTAFTESLRVFETCHDRTNGSYAILGLACCAAARHHWERAARLLGFADGQLQECRAVWPEPERTYRKQWIADIQRYLGADFDRCYDAWRADDRSDLIDLALSQQHTP
jgi:predicted ATPase